jgi:hypothetical protein
VGTRQQWLRALLKFELRDFIPMKRNFTILLSIMGMLLLIPNTYAYTSLRCNDSLVSLGDSRQDVEGACGPPTFIDTKQEERTVKKYQKAFKKHPDEQGQGAQNGVDKQKHKGEYWGDKRHLDRDYRLVNERTFLINIEEWTYNFGPDRFIQTLAFENGELVSITAGGYGFVKHLEHDLFVEKNDSRAMVIMKYGPPDYENKHQEKEASVNYREDRDYFYAEEVNKTIDVEEWVYDLGPDRFLQKLFFRNDRLVDSRSLKERGKKK